MGKRIWRVKSVSCDGGKLGAVSWEKFYSQEIFAQDKIRELVKIANDRELSRTETNILAEREDAERHGRTWWRLYTEDTVEGIKGYCNWAYTNMYILDEIEVDQ